MNKTKIILYALLGVVCFALWNAWQKDYPVANTSLAEKQALTSAAATTAANITPGITSTSISANDSAQQNLTTKKQLSQIPENRLIKVKTDVLDISIDPVGGNIARANLLQYKKSLDGTELVQLLSDNPENLSLSESGLISAIGPDLPTKQATYVTTKKNYILNSNQNDLQVALLWRGAKGLSVSKTFVFEKGSYDIKVNYDINNNGKQVWNGQFYAQLKNKYIPVSKSFFKYSSFSGFAISSPDKPYQKFTYDKLNTEKINVDIQGGWLAMQQPYFLSAWVPDKSKTLHYFSDVSSGDIYTSGFIDNNISIPAGSSLALTSSLYVGPEIIDNLNKVSPKLGLTVDYGWLWFISIALLWLMQQIYKVVGNWGVSIILVTVLIKLLFYKLSESSYRSMAHMKDLAPKIKALKERFADDKQKLNQAMMELYRKEKINPLGGCLPMVVQIPVFIGLYYVLIAAVELRQAPFVFWIHDLSAKDPFYVLPILMGLTMFIQQRLSPPSPDPAQAKMMMMLPIVFTIFFISFPSGLVLYWLVNNILSVLQQWYINKKFTKNPPVKKHR